jgi:5S rRNA maturation endonuclease (ribonuclease M5)
MRTLRDQIIERWPLDQYLQSIGAKVPENRNGKIMVSCPLHDDKTPSCSCSIEKGLWKCFSCGQGGTVIDLQMRITGMSCKDAMFALAEKGGIAIDDKPRKADTYSYKDAYGKDVMRVYRIEEGRKKRFAQAAVNPDGTERKGIEGVSRVLYRLERWHAKKQIAICEGEKCVHALESLGFDATTNPGGSNGWLSAYAESLKDKHVEIFPDRDEPGEKWLGAVMESLKGKCAALKVCRVPEPYNDAADVVEAKGDEMAGEIIADICIKSDWIERGIVIDLLSSREAYERYKRGVREAQATGLDLGRWLPSMRSLARPLQPGDLMLVLADTGVGKTGILSNIAYSQPETPVIFFELELSPEAMCERFIARDTGTETLDVERQTRNGRDFDVAGWGHVFICPNSKLTTEDMEQIIIESELKIGRKPGLVLVDYVGLVSGGAGKRYERMSTIAEDMKRLARITNTVVCIASQVSRKDDRTEIDLHDAKDSGSLENSAQLVMGAWRPDVGTMMLKILKQTRRSGPFTIECNYDGNRQKITERTSNEQPE